MILESDIEKRVVRKIKKLHPGVLCLKLRVLGDRGWPDRLWLFQNGVAVFIEFKRPGKKPRHEQLVKLKLLRRLGYHADWFDDEKAAVRFCRNAVQTPAVPDGKHRVSTGVRQRVVSRPGAGKDGSMLRGTG
jgi:hypothetical protein